MPTSLTIRPATADDIPHIVALYADDDLGRARDSAAVDEESYRRAFTAIDGDPHHVLAVGEIAAEVVATLLLSFLPGLSRGGSWRAQIEAMRVSSAIRGQGIGQRMLDWALAEARLRRCRLVRLTSDRTRTEAHRFYERAGFVPSHVGFKLAL